MTKQKQINFIYWKEFKVLIIQFSNAVLPLSTIWFSLSSSHFQKLHILAEELLSHCVVSGRGLSNAASQSVDIILIGRGRGYVDHPTMIDRW